MPKIPDKFSYLREQPLPPLMVRVALDMYGTVEAAGSADNPMIVGWADEVNKICKRTYDNWAADFYNKDSVPWCGLFMAVVAARASQGREQRFPPNKYLAALAWANWGVSTPVNDIIVGDVVVLVRNGGGHVTIAVGTSQNGATFFGLGGNQKNGVNIAEFGRDRIYAVRRPPYQNQPEGARKVVLSTTGVLSDDEQ